MSISESDRRAIYARLEPVLGEDVANNLMALLPHQPADELATRTDLHATTMTLRAEMAEMRAGLQTEMGELRSELRGEMGELRSDLRGEMAELRGELRSEMVDLRVSTQRWMSGAVAANTIAVVTALLT